MMHCKPRHVRGFAYAAFGQKAGAAESPVLRWLLGIGLGVLYAAAAVVSLRGGVRGDELYHYAQIELFRHGHWRVLDQYLTTIPGYHAAVAAVLAASGLDSLGAARTVNAGFGLIAIACFHGIRRRLWPSSETLTTAQFIALPILAPYFFLAYTDVLALALVLAAAWATLAGRHLLSGVLLLALVAVRQNAVVWAALLAALAAWPAWQAEGAQAWKRWPTLLAPYLVPLAAFLGFWAWNGSISLSSGQAGLHPDATLRIENPLFALFLAGLLLPLQALAGLRSAGSWWRRRPWALALPLALFAFYWFGFHADNPYNAALPQFLPRNAFLLALDGNPGLRAGAGLVIVIAACGLAPTRLRPPGAAWLYPLSAFFLASSWLVEQRYALVPLALWLAFRQPRGRAVELATLGGWLALAVFVICGIIANRFFL